MTKEQYFEMCEMMGSTPIEEEIPVDINDFELEVQIALEIYNMLPDIWEGMSGSYLGKNFAAIESIFNSFEIPKDDRLVYLKVLSLIDNIRASDISKKQKAKEKTATKS